MTEAHHKMMAAAMLRHAEYESGVAQAVQGMRLTASKPLFSTQLKFPAARLSDVLPMMQSGDRMLYAGVMTNPISALIRFETYSAWSHVGMIVNDDVDISLVDITAKNGCCRHSLEEAVAAAPGRWYWSHVSRTRFPEFSNDGVAAAALADVGTHYGYRGIILQAAIRSPGSRELALLFAAHEWGFFKNAPSFCSQGVKRWCADGGSVDPVPHQAANLVPPQGISQSLLWDTSKVALYPDGWEWDF